MLASPAMQRVLYVGLVLIGTVLVLLGCVWLAKILAPFVGMPEL